MGKKKHDKKAEPKLSKKEVERLLEEADAKARKKVAKREAEVDAREKKAAKKALKHSDEMIAAEKKKADREADVALEAAVADAKERAKPKKGGAEMKAALEADAEVAKARKAEIAADIDAQIAARVAKKAADQPGSAERTAEMQRKVAEDRERRHGKTMTPEDAASNPDPRAEDAAAEVAEHEQAEKKSKTKSVEVDGAKVAETTHIDISGEPETPAPVEFASPSESAQRAEFRENGNRQYVVKRKRDGKEVGYTRVTTYIDALEDKTMLTAWKMRMLLEGVAVADEQAATGERAESPTAKIRDLAHRRDLAIAKARKADRKGKLVPGQLATLVDGAWGDFKKVMNELADDLFEVGGGREAATKGTDIHNLCDIHDRDGMQAIDAMLEAGEITPTDHADVAAYAAAVRAMGLKVVFAEQTVVDHENQIAGRLDRVYLGKLPEVRDPKTDEVIYPGDTRARRYVGDIKTGRVDLGAGKIAQQIRKYAESEAYDLETQESSSHGANRSYGLLIHVPAGTGTATVHLVDLNVGAAGNKIVAEVRAFRNTGKKAITLGVDLAAAPTE